MIYHSLHVTPLCDLPDTHSTKAKWQGRSAHQLLLVAMQDGGWSPEAKSSKGAALVSCVSSPHRIQTTRQRCSAEIPLFHFFLPEPLSHDRHAAPLPAQPSQAEGCDGKRTIFGAAVARAAVSVSGRLHRRRGYSHNDQANEEADGWCRVQRLQHRYSAHQNPVQDFRRKHPVEATQEIWLQASVRLAGLLLGRLLRTVLPWPSSRDQEAAGKACATLYREVRRCSAIALQHRQQTTPSSGRFLPEDLPTQPSGKCVALWVEGA